MLRHDRRGGSGDGEGEGEGGSAESDLARDASQDRILASALESSNQTVPVSDGLAAWFVISVV